MDSSKLLFWLTEKKASSSEESESSWSDVCRVKAVSSDEETGEDEDRLFIPLMQYNIIKLKRKRVDNYIHIVDSWSDIEFKSRLGLSRKAVNHLIGQLEKSGFIASHKFGLKPLEPRLCFYIFLTFICSTEPLTPIATRFDISISSTFRVIRRVIAWLLTKLNDVIKWPDNMNNVELMSHGFVQHKEISYKVLGVIDCIHIRIEKPKGSGSREYYKNKGYYSIILQAVIDGNMRFINIYCGEPGSSNCTRVLKKSPLYAQASQDTMFIPHNTCLIGHSGYPHLQWLITPYRENKALPSDQKEFNSLLLSIRKLSDRTFNALKAKFKRVKCFSVYRNTSFITDAVVAACILHNYIVSENDLIKDE